MLARITVVLLLLFLIFPSAALAEEQSPPSDVPLTQTKMFLPVVVMSNNNHHFEDRLGTISSEADLVNLMRRAGRPESEIKTALKRYYSALRIVEQDNEPNSTDAVNNTSIEDLNCDYTIGPGGR
jgi:hypothetical protein